MRDPAGVGPLFDYADAQPPEEEIDRVRKRLADLLSPTPVPRDELVRMAGAPAPVVFAALVELSLAGRAALLPGGLVASA
jgi:DNA processing protein